jgi:hypothetical protein
VDLTHPDLQSNLLPGFNAANNINGGMYIDIAGDAEAHGTACAGIAAGVANNSIGIAGVAYNCRILPVCLEGSTAFTTAVANGINWARQNGTDVISMSFGCGETTAINIAIEQAATNGRNNNLGCVLVAASGNNSASTVDYPSRNPNVIAVGAIDRCGIRSGRIDIVPNSCDPWCPTCQPGSAYGLNLDVVAPGTNIYTTDIQGNVGYNHSNGESGNYYANFGGTSAACPHVSGVAALILSVRPDLTQAQVRQAIESTCTKLSGYSFSNNSARPNGTWNSEVGHGLVNAYSAVYSVAPRISGPSTLCSSATYTLLNGSATSWSVTPPFSISASNATSVTVTIDLAHLNGQVSSLTATVNGVPVSKGISACHPYIDGDSYIECKEKTYSISGIPTPYTVTWSQSSGLTLMSGQGTSLATYKNTGAGGFGTINAAISHNGSTLNLSKSVSFENPTGINLCYVGPTEDGGWLVRADFIGGNAYECWDYSWGWGASQGNIVPCWSPPLIHPIIPIPPDTSTFMQFSAPPPTFLWQPVPADPRYAVAYSQCLVTCTVTTTCGNTFTDDLLIDVPVPPPYSNYSLYPNPASSTLHFEVNVTQTQSATPQQTAKSAKSAKCEVQFFNTQTGGLTFKQTVLSFDTNFDIDLSSVPDGIYVLRLVRDGEIVQTQNIIVQH